MAARAGFQSVTPGGSGPAAAAMGPGTPGPAVRMGPAPGQGMYRSPMPGAAYPVREETSPPPMCAATPPHLAAHHTERVGCVLG